MIDVDIEQRLGAFELAVAFRAEAPIVGLFGRSGSGKTSVVNALAGTSDARSAVASSSTARRCSTARAASTCRRNKRRLGYVFQDGLLFPHLDVESNLLYGLHRAPAAARVIDPAHVIELLGLKALLRRLPRQALRRRKAARGDRPRAARAAAAAADGRAAGLARRAAPERGAALHRAAARRSAHSDRLREPRGRRDHAPGRHASCCSPTARRSRSGRSTR